MKTFSGNESTVHLVLLIGGPHQTGADIYKIIDSESVMCHHSRAAGRATLVKRVLFATKGGKMEEREGRANNRRRTAAPFAVVVVDMYIIRRRVDRGCVTHGLPFSQERPRGLERTQDMRTGPRSMAERPATVRRPLSTTSPRAPCLRQWACALQHPAIRQPVCGTRGCSSLLDPLY
jgi:hypothetical protein